METQVLIIGGGVTGVGVARDLALRGVDCILAEADDLNAGASGANHGLLHSGCRYVASDPHSAQECREENLLLKRLAPHVVEDSGGIFVAVTGDDEQYIADFPAKCRAANIPVRSLSIDKARDLEPAIAQNAIAAFDVPDATVDPFHLVLDSLSHAQQYGTRYLSNTKLEGFEVQQGKIVAARLRDMRSGQEVLVHAEQYVNAAGAWAGNVAAMAGGLVAMRCVKGTLLITHDRIARRVINRLRPPGDGDILVPGGTVSILGTTSVRVESLDNIVPSVPEVDLNVEQGSAMVPALASARYIRAYAGVRPLLLEQGGQSDRNASRGVALLDHECDGLQNFVTITGGKLTTFRLMAEQTADLICARLGVNAPCLTRTVALPASESWKWNEAGLARKGWLSDHDPGDVLLCECEMVPRSGVDAILDKAAENNEHVGLNTLNRRSRVGKGACQGTFCGLRLTSYLYDRKKLNAEDGVHELNQFLEERWKGQRPVLWGAASAQAELQEALYCGFMGLDLAGRNKG